MSAMCAYRLLAVSFVTTVLLAGPLLLVISNSRIDGVDLATEPCDYCDSYPVYSPFQINKCCSALLSSDCVDPSYCSLQKELYRAKLQDWRLAGILGCVLDGLVLATTIGLCVKLKGRCFGAFVSCCWKCEKGPCCPRTHGPQRRPLLNINDEHLRTDVHSSLVQRANGQLRQREDIPVIRPRNQQQPPFAQRYDRARQPVMQLNESVDPITNLLVEQQAQQRRREFEVENRRMQERQRREEQRNAYLEARRLQPQRINRPQVIVRERPFRDSPEFYRDERHEPRIRNVRLGEELRMVSPEVIPAMRQIEPRQPRRPLNRVRVFRHPPVIGRSEERPRLIEEVPAIQGPHARQQKKHRQRYRDKNPPTEEKVPEKPQLESSGQLCSICLLGLLREPVGKLICGHRFHYGCIERWLRTVEGRLCPYCRAPHNTVHALPQ